MALFGNSIVAGESGGMPDEMWQRLGVGPLSTPQMEAGPVNAPVINQPGLAGYFGRVLDPSTNNSPLGRALGMFGQQLMAQQPGLGGDIGRAMVGVRQQREQEQDGLLGRAMDRWRVESEMRRANQPVLQNVSGVGLVGYDPNTQAANLLVAEQPRMGEQERLYQMWLNEMDPARKTQLGLMLRGAQYSEPAIQAQIGKAAAVADAQGEARARHRAPDKPQYEYRTGPNGKLQRRRVN